MSEVKIYIPGENKWNPTINRYLVCTRIKNFHKAPTKEKSSKHAHTHREKTLVASKSPKSFWSPLIIRETKQFTKIVNQQDIVLYPQYWQKAVNLITLKSGEKVIKIHTDGCYHQVAEPLESWETETRLFFDPLVPLLSLLWVNLVHTERFT